MTNFDREVAERMIARSQEYFVTMESARNQGSGTLQIEYGVAAKSGPIKGMSGVDYVNWCIEHAAEYAQMVMFLLDEREIILGLQEDPIVGSDDGTDETPTARRAEIAGLPRIGEKFSRRWESVDVQGILAEDEETDDEDRRLYVTVSGVSSDGRQMTSRVMTEFKQGLDRKSLVNAESFSLKVTESGVMTGLWIYHPMLGGHILSLPRAVAFEKGATMSVENGRGKVTPV